jgi:uncharacterized cupin superfamily protein
VFTVPADLELNPAPIAPHLVIEGNPRARSRRLSASADGTSSTMVWVCSAGRFHWNYLVDETLYVVFGEVHVTNEKGEVHHLVPGDLAHFPAGSRSIWYVPHEVTKIAFCRHSMPLFCGYALRAWNKLIALATGFDGGALEGDKPATAPADTRRATAA